MPSLKTNNQAVLSHWGNAQVQSIQSIQSPVATNSKTSRICGPWALELYFFVAMNPVSPHKPSQEGFLLLLVFIEIPIHVVTDNGDPIIVNNNNIGEWGTLG